MTMSVRSGCVPSCWRALRSMNNLSDLSRDLPTSLPRKAPPRAADRHRGELPLAAAELRTDERAETGAEEGATGLLRTILKGLAGRERQHETAWPWRCG